MRIGEIAQQVNLSVETIRWYEKIGLIASKRSQTGNNYRDFDPKDVSRLQLIITAKSFGLTIQEIKALLDLDHAGNQYCSEISGMFDVKIEHIERQIKTLKEIKIKLINAKEKCQGQCLETIKSVEKDN